MAGFKLQKEQFLFLIRYFISGATGIVIQTLSLFVWVSVLKLHDAYLWGVVIGFCIALATSFALQKYWTFRERTHATMHRQAMWYTAVALGTLFFNTILLAGARHLLSDLGLNFFHIWYLIAQFTILLLLAAVAFLINTAVTFRQ